MPFFGIFPSLKAAKLCKASVMAFWGADSVWGSWEVGSRMLLWLLLGVCLYLWRLSPSISFAIEFGIIFHFCLRISHIHAQGVKATSGLNGSLSVIGWGNWWGRKQLGSWKGSWCEKPSYQSRLHVWTSFVSNSCWIFPALALIFIPSVLREQGLVAKLRMLSIKN